MKKVRIICRNSRLSLIQAELVKEKILGVQPDAVVVIIPRTSLGDRDLSVPLSALDGTDFFTQEIFEVLQRDEADIAVHSLKDMSAPHFFSHDAFAIVDRDDVRDVAIFNEDIIEKLKNGEVINIGTCSPRRQEMAIGFLKKALPQFGSEIKIEVKPIRGNLEGRLKQIHDRKFDATILATAGLNRLLRDDQKNKITGEHSVSSLLEGKRLMLLPLIECAPAPCQAAIVAEANPQNTAAVELIRKINQRDLLEEVTAEKRMGFEFGTGCLQRFGVVSIKNEQGTYVYAAGEDQHGAKFSKWSNLPELELEGRTFFSSTDHMRDFFSYAVGDFDEPIESEGVFVANYKTLLHPDAFAKLVGKKIWASGTKTWFELAKLGLWVEGSADAMGFEKMESVLKMPLFNINIKSLTILTHCNAAARWREKGYKAVSNYELSPNNQNTLKELIADSTAFFWSSFSQYEFYGKDLDKEALHLCAAGETAVLLRNEGLAPVIFPTIKSFELWRKSTTRILTEG